MNKGQVWSAMNKSEVMRNHRGLSCRLWCTPPSMPTMDAQILLPSQGRKTNGAAWPPTTTLRQASLMMRAPCVLPYLIVPYRSCPTVTVLYGVRPSRSSYIGRPGDGSSRPIQRLMRKAACHGPDSTPARASRYADGLLTTIRVSS